MTNHDEDPYWKDRADRRYNDYRYDGIKDGYQSKDWMYIDIDGALSCRRCWEPLALIEISRDLYKQTIIIYKIAQRVAGGQSYLLGHTDFRAWLIVLPDENEVPKLTPDTVVKIKFVYPQKDQDFTDMALCQVDDLERELRKTHQDHCMS